LAYHDKLKTDIAHWSELGLIDKATGQNLIAASLVKSQRFGLGGTLAILAAILIGAAIITFVSANWQDMPRIVRLGLLLLLIWAGFVAGAWRTSRGDKAFGEGLLFIGGISFGASIALVGQMYHLSGADETAVLVWWTGCAAGAAFIGSPALTALCAVLVGARLLAFSDGIDITIRDYVAWGMWLVSVGLAYMNQSRTSRHLLLLALLCLALFEIIREDALNFRGLVISFVAAFVYIIATRNPNQVKKLTGFETELPGYGVAFVAFGLIATLIESWSTGSIFDSEGRRALLTLVLVGVSIFALLDRGATDRGVRWMSYIVFAIGVIWLANDVLGSLMGTSGVFLGTGLSVLVLAFVVVRSEKRVKIDKEGGALS
jgi:uncharacterized membrane protein